MCTGHGDVGLVPEADVGSILGDGALGFDIEPAALFIDGGRHRRIDQAIDFRILVVTAVEAIRRHLLRVKHAAQHVGIRHANPLQREQLEVALQHIRVKRREFVRPDVELDADLLEILLDHRRL